MSATEARNYAKQILAKCSDCFKNVKAQKKWGQWEISINGGSGACYGKTLRDAEDADEILRIFAND